METEFDINEVVVRLVEQNVDTFVKKGQQLIGGAKNAVRVKVRSTYSDYLRCLYDRYSHSKSFFIRDEAVPLYDFYVPMGLSCNDQKMSIASMKKISSIGKLAIITGGGGSGKSTMMRHLLIDSIRSGEKIPVFVELRALNQSEQTVIELVKDTLSSNKLVFNDDYIDKALDAGHFVFFFDGLDEILRSKQETIGKQIQKLASKYDENWIVISSRPDNGLFSWQQFNVFAITDLTIGQACELIQKIPYDESIKSKFVEALRESLYQKHRSFLSNPLLLSIMLLTYGENADIPNKLSLFYNQAYETLFQRHDALKGGFRRDRNTRLDIQDFAKVFSAFSIQTYDQRLFDFSPSVARDYLSKAKKLTNLEFNEEEYLSDATQAVNLLVEDGVHLQFTHRSFQEYFTAIFVREANVDIQRKLISKYFGQDNVISLLHEMKPEIVEDFYIIPELNELHKKLKIEGAMTLTHYLEFLRKLCNYVAIESTDFLGFHINDNEFFNLIHFLYQKYFPRIQPNPSITSESLAKKYGKEGKSSKIELKSITTRHWIVKELADDDSFFSKNTLIQVMKLREQLIEKQRSSHQSLDEILGI
jgi:hypothetical protein